MDYQTGLCEKYLVTGDWGKSDILSDQVIRFLRIHFIDFNDPVREQKTEFFIARGQDGPLSLTWVREIT